MDGLKDVARSALETITDYDTMGEMLTFVYDEAWKPQAEEGEHDDLVLSLAIAHFIRSQQSTQVRNPAANGRDGWTRDMWEDYNKASQSERETLVKLWGEPGGSEQR